MSEPRLDVAHAGLATRDRSPWWGVHAARYHFAAPYARNRRVLDIACGTGYGMSILRASARSVIGVDVDWAAARRAVVQFGVQSGVPSGVQSGGGAVLVGDGERLPFGEATFDVVTSFETIEHLQGRAQFVSELRRVLRPDGVCVLSTPNAIYTQPVDGRPRNPYHVHEYTPDELTNLLGQNFARVDLLGQDRDSRFRISPFWDDQQRLSHGVMVQARLLLWRVFNRLPAAVGDTLSRLLLRQPLIPGEHDYRFFGGDVAGVPVLVAVCRPHP